MTDDKDTASAKNTGKTGRDAPVFFALWPIRLAGTASVFLAQCKLSAADLAFNS